MAASVLAFLLAQALALPSPKETPASVQREPVQRTITITDETISSVPEVRVGADWPTTLVFSTPLSKDNQAVMLAQPGHEFAPPKFTDTSVILIPRKDLPANGGAALTVTLSDGNILSFKLVSVPKAVDLRVDVELKLTKRAAPDSPEALRTTLEQLRAQVEECQSSSASAGVAKIGALVLAEKSPAAVEMRKLGKTDKQSRMLVTARYEYRLFGYAFVVFEIQNRDDTKIWELDGADVKLQGSGPDQDVQVASAAMDPNAIEPNATGRIVVAFKVPDQQRGQQFIIGLHEKNGSRHVQLDNLGL
jgi:uncharacterized protein (TIGR02268 family)